MKSPSAAGNGPREIKCSGGVDGADKVLLASLTAANLQVFLAAMLRYVRQGNALCADTDRRLLAGQETAQRCTRSRPSDHLVGIFMSFLFLPSQIRSFSLHVMDLCW